MLDSSMWSNSAHFWIWENVTLNLPYGDFTVNVNLRLKAIQYDMNNYPICDSPLKRSAWRSFAPLQKSRQNPCSYVCKQKLYPVWFSCRRKSCPVQYEHLSDMQLSTLEIGAAQLRSVTEIAPKSPLLCVNRSPIRYGFRAGAKDIQYNVNIV